ncbi:hypothetical protein SANA_03580 [Gottschalkiaceae bacterium SANA]|nr:hypothetical protein SANA_03580 [Gottschalkiaceae bacterium SANA]
MSLFSGHAKGIVFSSKEDFFEVLGYLAKSDVLVHFEAQVPTEKIAQFKSELPGQSFYEIDTTDRTRRGDPMKTGVQLRLYFEDISKMPLSLKAHVVKGNRINRGVFAEELLKNYGFVVGFSQNSDKIRDIIETRHPKYIPDFDRGLAL